ncbi:MAG TPA: isochorismate synthase [Thermaerobacter sp.]
MKQALTSRLLLDLERLAARAAGLARRIGRPAVVVSVTAPAPPADPVTLFQRASSWTRSRTLWMAPRGELALVGLGAAAVIEAFGPEPVRPVEAAWRDLVEGAMVEGPAGAWGTGPVLLGGLAFDPAAGADPVWEGFPPARFVLPALLYTRDEGGAWVTLTRVVGAATDLATNAANIPAAGATAAVTGDGGAGERVAIRFPMDPAPTGEGQRWLAWLEGVAAEPDRPTCGEGDRASDAAPDRAVTAVSGAAVTGMEEHPGPGAWRQAVEQALAAIARGELRKVVLSRRVCLRTRTPFDAGDVLRRLRAGYPDCFLFCIPGGDAFFLGATPERLARVRAGSLETAAVAGSTRRGETEERDRELGRALLANPKERAEHALVVEMLREALAPLCESLEVPAEPALLRLGNVQHLHTPIRGAVRGRSVLQVVARLHPTPAVGGVPRGEALRFIRQQEPAPRGWYAAPVGWLDHHGEGEFAVAIRSGLLRGAEAWLFAGCGIVPGSDPQREYEETRLKLQPLLSALGAGDAVRGEGWM